MTYKDNMLWRTARGCYHWLQLPGAAKAAQLADLKGLPPDAPDIERAIDEAVAWLGRAQDHSASHDGGAARDYSLIKGWATSYPETSGYIVPTLLDYARRRDDETVRKRATDMLDWLVSIQFPDGAFQGGRIDSVPVAPVTFNTGQILIGLAAGAAEFGEPYLAPMNKAAQWLVDTQSSDGCWRGFPTPFAEPGEKAYETHVSWGLFEAARVAPDSPYAEAGLRNVAWALKSQHPNGWFDKCCLSDPARPLTHTLGYVLRGLLEAYRFSNDSQILEAARLTADGLLDARDAEGYLPGRLYPDWSPAVQSACLTGTVQIAHCWLMLFEFTGDKRYLDAGKLGNHYVRRTITIDGRSEIRGAIKGSFPVNGDYGAFEYLNWAAKFFADSHMHELDITQ